MLKIKENDNLTTCEEYYFKPSKVIHAVNARPNMFTIVKLTQGKLKDKFYLAPAGAIKEIITPVGKYYIVFYRDLYAEIEVDPEDLMTKEQYIIETDKEKSLIYKL